MLDDLFAGALADSAMRSGKIQSVQLKRLIESAPPAMNALERIRPVRHVTVIAEIKRASPSRGFLAEIANPGQAAATYQRFGAAAISVLTEHRRFNGNLTDLDAVRAEVSIPVLRKDFIATEYQILEARAHGADMVLLIATWLPERRLQELLKVAADLGMVSLVETHSEAEIEVAAAAGAELIGINTRDLETFKTDIGLFERLAQRLPKSVVKVAESSVRMRADIERYRDAGADAVLIGEALVTGNPEELLAEFTSVTI